MAGANEDEPQAIVKRQDFAITHVGRAAVGGAEARVSFLSTHAESFQTLSAQVVIRSIHTALNQPPLVRRGEEEPCGNAVEWWREARWAGC
jgi:hypothetical protein